MEKSEKDLKNNKQLSLLGKFVDEISDYAYFSPDENENFKEEILEENFLLAYLFQCIPEMLFFIDSSKKIIRTNKTAREIIGKADKKIIGKYVGDVLNCVPYRKNYPAKKESCLSGCEECALDLLFEQVLKNKNNTREEVIKIQVYENEKILEKLFLSTAIFIKIKDKECVVLALKPIVENIHLGNNYKGYQEKSFEFLESIPLIALQLNNKGDILFLNNSGKNSLGIEDEDVKNGLHLLDFICEEHQQEIFEELAELIKGSKKMSLSQLSLRRKNGSIFHALAYYSLTKNPVDKSISYTVLFIDINDQEKKEEALARSEEKYRSLFDSANDIIFVFSLSKNMLPEKFIEINNTGCLKLGYTREEFSLIKPREIFSKETGDKIPEILNTLNNQGFMTFEMTLFSKNGLKIPVEISSHVLQLQNEKVVLSVARDISERKT
jgi:PAS domain S-box-containing protein